MLVALLYALIYIAVIAGVAYIARWAVGEFQAPLSPPLSAIVNMIIGLVAFIACILVLIQVVSGSGVAFPLLH